MFFTTNVNAETGVVGTAGFTTANTKEIQVLDGLSFSQNTTAETVTINEAGDSPTRGQRNFNTALDPVELSFSTYLRPFFAENAGTSAYDNTDTVEAEEDVLWNAFATGDNGIPGDQLIGTAQTIGDPRPATGTAGHYAAWRKFVGAAGVEPYSTVTYDRSAKNQLQKFGVIIVLDSTSYVIDNCVLDQASIDFGIDAIATVAWTARGSVIRAADLAASEAVAGTVTFSGTYLTGTGVSAKGKETTAPFLANKLSVVELLAEGIEGAGPGYTLALTGGNITLSNNVTYLTPANLGIVNKPFTYFTGTRAVSGSLNCYLKTGTTNSGALLTDLLAASATNVDPAYNLKLSIGGKNTLGKTRVVLHMPATVLTIPTINTEQVVSTTINFTAQGYDSGTDEFDICANNEITITYYSANTTV